MIMQRTGLDVGENRAERSARNRRGLIGSNHQRESLAFGTPVFNGLIAPPDYQEALSLDRYFFALTHDFSALSR